jgi:hypothetical protein
MALLKRFVYVIGNSEYGWAKIGISGNLKRRLAALQNACPVRLQVLFGAWAEYARAAEQRLHEILADLRAKGEWFKLDEPRIRAAFAELGLHVSENEKTPEQDFVRDDGMRLPLPTGETIRMYRRHNADCPHRIDRHSRDCRCRIWLHYRSNGKSVQVSTKSRVWENAEVFANRLQGGVR